MSQLPSTNLRHPTVDTTQRGDYKTRAKP